VLEFLAAIGQDFREDRSNRDVRFTRNRLRHELLPYLAEHFNSDVTEALVRLARHATQAQATIDAVVEGLRRRAVVRQDPEHLALNVTPLRRSPRYIVCELIRQLWGGQSWPLQEIGQEALDRIAHLVDTGTPQSAWDLPGGVRAERTRGRLLLSRKQPGPTQ
jgi:tRNA(Ile)-lysidine synthase